MDEYIEAAVASRSEQLRSSSSATGRICVCVYPWWTKTRKIQKHVLRLPCTIYHCKNIYWLLQLILKYIYILAATALYIIIIYIHAENEAPYWSTVSEHHFVPFTDDFFFFAIGESVKSRQLGRHGCFCQFHFLLSSSGHYYHIYTHYSNSHTKSFHLSGRTQNTGFILCSLL